MSSGGPAVGISAFGLPAREVVHLGIAAEAAGFDSLWVGEHVVLPADSASQHPANGHDKVETRRTAIDSASILSDPLVTLAAVAACTTRLQLGTAIYLLPLRPPLVTARMAASLAELSGGRFQLGVGAGWLAEEFAAVGVPFEERHARYRESLHILRKAFAGGTFEHSGRFWSTGAVQISPTPVRIRLILGGNSDGALRRAVRESDGWFSSGTPSPDEAQALLKMLHAHAAREGRTAPLQVYMRMEDPTGAELARYRRYGCDSVVVRSDRVWPSHGDIEDKQRALTAAAQDMGLRTPGG